MTKSLILLMAGSGSRMKMEQNKVLYKVLNTPLFMYSLKTFMGFNFDQYLLVVAKDEIDEVTSYIESLPVNIKIICGGITRKDSVKNALKEVTSDVVFIHDGARPLIAKEDVKALLNESYTSICGTLYHDLTDTLRTITNPFTTYDRNLIKGISTPQFFNQTCIKTILNNVDEITDEISLFANLDVKFVKETHPNLKVTTKEDLDYVKYLLTNNYDYFIGHSLDYHPYKQSGNLILGGVIFNDYPSLDGHSDADVVYHCVTEAIMGAMGLGDLGTLFPDTDDKYLNIDSSLLLQEVMKIAISKGYQLQNIDVMIYALEPKLKDYKKQMASNIQRLTNCMYICVKAATLNKHGLIALKEGIGAEATVLIKKDSN